MDVDRGRTGSGRSQQSVYSEAPTRYKQRPLGARIKDCCRFTIAFMFSNVGVCGLMVGYTIMGSFLFTTIEGQTEAAKMKFVASHRNETIKTLWNLTETYNTLFPEKWNHNVTVVVQEYQKFIVAAIIDGWDGTDGEHGPSQWSLEGGFLYSLTVITTIGYGHIHPDTNMGKIVTIFYTIFGMPVFLLYMANMGDILAKSLKWAYAKVCMCTKRQDPQYDTSAVWRSADAILRGAAAPVYIPPSDSYNGEFSDDDGRGDGPIRTVSGQVDRQSGGMGHYGSSSRRPMGPQSDLMYLQTDQVSVDTPSWRSNRSQKTDLNNVNIPITVSLVIMIALLYGGTKLFQAYEGWDWLTSFYFCFISLTTIGFGDYVPGSSVESIASGNRMSFIYCSLYLMFGLALLSMCFNLMQEEVVHKVNTCMKSIRLFKKKDPD